MSWLKKSKKSHRPSERPTALGIPLHIGLAALGINAELGPEGVESRPSAEIVLQDRAEDQRPHPLRTSISTPTMHERAREEIFPNVPNERPGKNGPDPSTAESQLGLRDRGERSGQGTVAEQPPAPIENTLDGDCVGGEAPETVKSEFPDAAERGRDDGAIRNTTTRAEEAVRGFWLLKSILSAVCTNYEEIVTIRNKAEDLKWRVDALEKEFNSPPGTVTEQRRRNEVIRKCKEIEGGLQAFSRGSEPRRRADHDQGKVTEFLEDLREVIFDYQTTKQKEVHDQRREEMNQADAAVLNNFRSARGAEHQHTNRKGCLKGTRGAVLDAIELWARDSDKSPIYWLNGLAGTGKTTIAQTIAERLFANGRLGASFFCSRDFEDRSNLQLIFPTLAIQLARNYTEFRSRFVQLVRSNPDIAYESLFNQVDRLIAEPLRGTAISTVIIIDALDECNDDGTTSVILSVLGRLAPEVPNVKFFLTGRPEPRIQTGFRLPLLKNVTDVFILHDVEPSLITNDIRLFLNHSFLEMANRRGNLDDWPTNEEVELLCKRAAGLFIYAVAMIKFIDKQSSNPRRQLNLLLQSPECTAREGKTRVTANTTLDSLYTSILQGAFGDDKDADNDPIVRSVLGAMVLVVNPLSPSAIATLLGFDVELVFPLLSSTQSLLILQDIDYPVRPFHKSFPDFITNPDRCTDARFFVSPPDHHSRLLISCLGLMDQMLEKNICELPDGVANSDVGDLKERVERYIDPSLRYACISWHRHLVDEPTTVVNTPGITSALRQFLEKKFLFWLEVLSVLGAVRTAIDALQAATDWLKDSYTLDLVNDCSRFVTGYFEIISVSSSHIYHSALVLAPKTSIIRKLYESDARPLIRIVHGLPVSWGLDSTTTQRPFTINLAAWSLCGRFLAISPTKTKPLEILDPLTLQRLQSLKFPPEIPGNPMALVFSPDGRMLTCAGFCRLDRKTFVVSWDLETGGAVGGVQRQAPRRSSMLASHITCSMNGKIVGVLFRYDSADFISIYDVASGVYMYDISHSPSNGSHPSPSRRLYNIWTHGESLRFISLERRTVIIWEVELAPGATPAAVETLPDLEDALLGSSQRYNQDAATSVQFHPAPHRLTITRPHLPGTNGVQVWDIRGPKTLLRYRNSDFYSTPTFSSDGRFFACSTTKSEVYLWKESSTGYILHKKLPPSTKSSTPLLSPNGESIIVFNGPFIQLWHTKNLTTTLPTTLTQAQRAENFVLDFLPGRSFAVVARQKDTVVTVIDLESGLPWLTFDTRKEVDGLKASERTVVVVNSRQVSTWDLPEWDSPPGARGAVNGNTQTINFRRTLLEPEVVVVSVSLDFRYVALIIPDFREVLYLDVYNLSTGVRIGTTTVDGGMALCFKPGGHDVWVSTGSRASVWTISQDGTAFKAHAGLIDDLRESPWQSSLGYKVTNDWWIVDPNGKRLLILPPSWQSGTVQRVWNGQFLALLHGTLPESVILELGS